MAFFTCEITGIAIDMDGRPGRQNRTRVNFAAPCMDQAIFVLDAMHHKAAYRCNGQCSPCGDGTHHGAKRINMSAKRNAAGGVLTFQGYEGSSLFVLRKRKAKG
ncbi:hypothetical protein D3C77_526110 [compost metagenome]